MKSALFVTLGCRLNQLETEGIAQAYREAGWQICFGAPTGLAGPPPDLCVVNTCTVTSKAEQKVRRAIRDLLRRYPEATVAVTGCYAVVEGVALSALDARVRVVPQKEALLPALDEWGQVVPRDEALLPLLDEGMQVVPQKEALLPALDGPGGFFPFTAEFGAHSRSLLKVQDGCDGHCTYCRIRLARGPSRSLGAAEVLRRLRLLEAAGHREAVLTGVNLGAWAGGGPPGPPDLTGLIGYLLAGTSTIALRISSLHPTTITEAFAAVVSHPRVRPHFHLSVQSGSDAILAAMGRSYDAAATLEAVERLRGAKEAPFIGCDMIVGFPGETSADFAATLALCRAARFAWVHCFPFSPRPGTAAASLPGALPQRITGERARTLTSLAEAAKLAYVSAFQGRTLPAIVEHHLRRAVTANFLHVTLDPPAPPELAGQEVNVSIVEPLGPQHGEEGETEARGRIA